MSDEHVSLGCIAWVMLAAAFISAWYGQWLFALAYVALIFVCAASVA